MAKDKKLKTDGFQLDPELDFDFDNFDDIDSQIDPDLRDTKSRSVVTKAVKGVVGGAANQLSNPSFIQRVARKGLPDVYGDISDTVGKTTQTITELSDHATRELKPQLGKIAKTVDRLVPDKLKRTKKLTGKIADFFGDSQAGQGVPSKEQVQDNSVKQMIDQIFEQQQKSADSKDAYDKASNQIESTVRRGEFRNTISVLQSMDRNIGDLTAYNNKVNQAVQKKQLGIQLHSLFALREIASTNRQYFEVFKNQLDAVSRNTSLPEFVKIKNSERFKEIARNKLVNKVQDSLFGKGSVIEQGLTKMKKDAKDYISGLKSGLELASFGAEELEELKRVNEENKALGLPTLSAAELAGNMAGGWLANKAGDKVGAAYRRHAEQNAGLNKALYAAGNALANPGGTINGLRRSDRMQDAIAGGGVKGKLAGALDKGLGYFTDSAPSTKIANPYGENGIEPQYFNEKTQRSITDIIPGYLARILREIKVTRTGDEDTSLTYYDQSNGKFVDKNTISQSLSQGLLTASKNSTFGSSVRSATTRFIDGRDVDDASKQKIGNFLTELSRLNNQDLSPEEIMKTKAFTDLTSEDKALVKGILDHHSSDTIADRGKYKIAKSVRGLREATPDLRKLIESMVDNGYGDILEGQGLITRDATGGYEINMDEYYKLLKSGTTVLSDETKKTSIKPLSGKAALYAVNKTPISSWSYKRGQGDGSYHNGPMAQDVFKTMGNNAAPGGRKIDLTTMNGNNMAAIQELSRRVTSVSGEAQTGNEPTLAENVSAIRKLMENGQSTSTTNGNPGNGPRDYQGLMGQLFGASGELLSKATGDIFEGTTKTLGNLGKGAMSTGKWLGDQAGKLKDPVVNGFKSLLGAAGEAAAKALEVGKDIVFNQLPKAWSKAMTVGGKLKEKLLSLYNDFKDVYIPGQIEPALRASLLKAGYYKDAITGKVITSMDDLANLKGDVINKAGEVVLTIQDASQGLYDQTGALVKTSLGKLWDQAKKFGSIGLERGKDFLGALSKHGGSLFGKLSGFAGKAKDKLSNIDMPGIGFGGEKIYQVLVEIRGILRGEDPERHESILSSLKSKKGEALQKAQDSLVEKGKKTKKAISDLAASVVGGASGGDSAQGELFGPDEAPVPQPQYSSGGNTISGLFEKAKGLGGQVAGSGIFDRFKRRNPAADPNFVGPMPGPVPGPVPAAGRLGRLGAAARGFGGKALGGIGAITSLVGGVMGGGKEEGQQPQQMDMFSNEHDATPKKKRSFLSSVAGVGAGAIAKGKRAFNDRDGNGRREGSWEDRLDAQKKADADKGGDQETGKVGAAKYFSGKDIFDMIKDKAAGVMGVAGKLLSGAQSVLGMGAAGGNMISGLWKGISGLLALGGKGFKALGAPLKAIGRATQFVGRAAGLGRLAGALGTIRNIATVGALATGGAGSVVMGALSAGLTAVGAVVSSPVVLGALAVAAAGYGAYKLYKYMNRDNVDAFEDIRMKQYGIGTGEADKKYNHNMLVLEEYLSDGRIGYNSNQAYLLDQKIDPKEILEIFSIDEKDEEAINKFNIWFGQRFKPFFLTHKTALFSIDTKAKLSDVAKLDVQKQIKYLNLVSFESGPYDVTVSPFKDLDHLNPDPTFALNAIKALIAKLSKDSKASAKAPVVPVVPKPSAAPTFTPPKNEVSQALQDKQLKQNQAANKVQVETSAEDGAVNERKISQTASKSLSTVSALKMASGAILDGTNGMQYIKLAPGVKIDTMNPEMLKNLLGMAQEYGESTGKSILVTSGTRSTAEQAELYRKDPSKAARPGSSMHEFGLAMDVNSSDLNQLEDMGLMRKYGFTRPVGGEPWHMEASGLQTNVSRSKQDSNFASAMIAASLNRGGGGVGGILGSQLGRRDSAYAVSLLDAGDISVKDKIQNTAEAIKTDKPVATSDRGNVIQMADYKSKFDPSKISNIKQASSSLDSYSKDSAKSTSSLLPDTESFKFGKGDSADASSGDGDVKDRISSLAKSQNVDPNDILTFAAMESSLNPSARAGGSSSAQGLYGFTNLTWKETVGKSPNRSKLGSNPSPLDVDDSTLMATDYYKSNAKMLSGVKSNVGITDVYLAHFLGPTGARKFLSADPNAIAANILPDAAAANKSYFYDGGRPLTIGEVYKKIDEKLSKKASEFGIKLKGGNTLPSVKRNLASSGDAPPVISYDNGNSSGGVSSPQTKQKPTSDLASFSSQAAPISMRSTSNNGVGKNAGADFSKFDSIDDTLLKTLEVQKEMVSEQKKLNTILTTFLEAAAKSKEAKTSPDQPKASPFQDPKGNRQISPTIDISRKSA